MHKSANELSLPQSMQGKAKKILQDIYLAETRAAAEVATNHFIALYKVKYARAVECLENVHEALLTFYDFPSEH